MAVSIRTLVRLHFCQFFRTESRSRLYGDIVGIVYLWILEIVLFVLLKKEGAEIPSMAAAIASLACLVPDFLLKLIMIQDNTVMDPFLKTRPVHHEKWDRFLALAQFWNPSNLVMPLGLVLGCFLFMPFFGGLFLFIFLYLSSVFGGFLVMLFKHRGNYQPEVNVRSRRKKNWISSRGGHVFGIQLRSFLRSRRIKTMTLYFGILLFLQCIAQEGREAFIFYFAFIFITSSSFLQYGMAVEANFFSGIWTRPMSLERLLTDKYRIGIILSGVCTLLCLPLCIWKNLSLLTLFAMFIFIACFCNLLMLFDTFNCVPFDLFGKAFFNNQGRNTSVKAISVISLFVALGLGAVGISVLDGWKTDVFFIVIGLVSFFLSKPYLKFLVGRFDKNRYSYMEKYNAR